MLSSNSNISMELSYQISSILSSTHRVVLKPCAFSTTSCKNFNQFRRRNFCLASNSDTLVAGKSSEEIVSKKEDEIADLKTWMHENGLPPCKVLLKDRPCRVIARPIHYVAASQDLQVSCFRFGLYVYV